MSSILPPPAPAGAESAPAGTANSGNETTLKHKKPSNSPNATLYVGNIDWNIKKGVLKRALMSLFGRHGKILEVIVLRKDGLRGQAWIIFDVLAAAMAACQAENSFVFFGRPLFVDYAKEKSDRVAKREGSYVPANKDRRKAKQARTDGGPGGGEGGTMMGDPMAVAGNVVTSVQDPSSLVNGNGGAGAGASSAEVPAVPSGPAASNVPSNILFARDLPNECNELMLAMLFRQYSGYKQVKLSSDASGSFACVEFESEKDATAALKGLNGFKLTTSASLNLTYGTSMI